MSTRQEGREAGAPGPRRPAHTSTCPETPGRRPRPSPPTRARPVSTPAPTSAARTTSLPVPRCAGRLGPTCFSRVVTSARGGPGRQPPPPERPAPGALRRPPGERGRKCVRRVCAGVAFICCICGRTGRAGGPRSAEARERDPRQAGLAAAAAAPRPKPAAAGAGSRAAA